MDSGNKTSILNSRRKRNRRIVDTVVTDHFEMFVGDMDNKPLNKFNSGNGFNNELVIFVPVVMEGNMRTGVRIDAGSGNNGSAEVTTNILGNDRRIAVIGLSVNVESLGMILIDGRFDFLKGGAKFVMEAIKKSGAEGIAQESIVKVFYVFPRGDTPDSDFRDKNVNMRIPLKAAPEGVKNTDKAGSKMLCFIEFAEHAKNDVADGMKKTVE